MLFCDISGFTKLSTRLDAENLKKHINKLFTKIVHVIVSFGGDIIKFAGDAMFILWPTSDSDVIFRSKKDNMERCAQMAGACGLAIVEKCNMYEVPVPQSSPRARESRSISINVRTPIQVKFVVFFF